MKPARESRSVIRMASSVMPPGEEGVSLSRTKAKFPKSHTLRQAFDQVRNHLLKSRLLKG